MSYHVKDLIADLATLEKAELMIDTIDLLDTVNYGSHFEKLEDVLMTIDMYSPSESLNLIESILMSSLIDCCRNYGLYIDENNYDAITLNKVFMVTNSVFDLISDEGKNFDDSAKDDDDNVSKMIGFLTPLTELDEDQLNEIIEGVDDDLITSIEENEQILETSERTKINSLTRLRNTRILNDCTVARNLILATGYGFDFYETLSLVKTELINITDLRHRSFNFIAILLASDVDDKDINNYFDETIDYLAEGEQEAVDLRAVATNVLREIQND